MVGERRVRILLQRIEQNVAFLVRSAATDRRSLRADEIALSAVKYRFVVAIEGCVNVAQHLCASEGWGPPSTNADAMRVLARNRVLDDALASALAVAVGFRNLLIHEYDGVDDDKVVGYLDRLGDLQAFVTAVSAWVEEHREE